MSVVGALLKLPTTVVIPRDATNEERVEKCRKYGSQVILAENRNEAFDLVEKITAEKGYDFIHPFDSVETILGTATLGLEILEQSSEPFDQVFVPVGGGGLAAGISFIIKQLKPHIRVIGVEPRGSNTLELSLKEGRPVTMTCATSVADSLTPPTVGRLAFEICKQYLDEVVTVTEKELCNASKRLFAELRLPIEPAGSCSFAASPIGCRPSGTRNLFIISGSNIPLNDLAAIHNKVQ